MSFTPATALRLPPEGKPRALRPVLAPRIYEGGGPRSGRGSLPAAAGTALSVTASPCQLSQRESQGRFAPFLPPAFMRGEGREAAGGVPRGGGESLLSHGFAVPAPPEGKPRVLRTVPAPRRGSRGRFAPFLPPAFMRGEGHEVAGGVLRRSGENLLSHGFAVPAPPEGKPRALRAPTLAKGEPRGLRTVLAPLIYEGGGPRSGRGSPPQQRGRPSQSRLRRASSPGGEAKGASHRSCPPHL